VHIITAINQKNLFAITIFTLVPQMCSLPICLAKFAGEGGQVARIVERSITTTTKGTTTKETTT